MQQKKKNEDFCRDFLNRSPYKSLHWESWDARLLQWSLQGIWSPMKSPMKSPRLSLICHNNEVYKEVLKHFVADFIYVQLYIWAWTIKVFVGTSFWDFIGCLSSQNVSNNDFCHFASRWQTRKKNMGIL